MRADGDAGKARRKTLARYWRFREIVREKLRLLPKVRHKQKTPEKPLLSRLFQGLMR